MGTTVRGVDQPDLPDLPSNLRRCALTVGRNWEGLEGDANAHLKLVRHHAFAHRVAEKTLLRHGGLRI